MMKKANAGQLTSDPGIDRRAAIALGLVGASAVAFTGTGPAAAQGRKPVETKEVAKGIERKVYEDVESMIPGFAKVRLVEVTWQPGASSGPHTMENFLICEMSQGELRETINGQPVTRRTGDVWTCPIGQVDTDTDRGNTPATMRIFTLLKA
jgi:quercetin dioxygenase-like cupin family protein